MFDCADRLCGELSPVVITRWVDEEGRCTELTILDDDVFLAIQDVAAVLVSNCSLHDESISSVAITAGQAIPLEFALLLLDPSTGFMPEEAAAYRFGFRQMMNEGHLAFPQSDSLSRSYSVRAGLLTRCGWDARSPAANTSTLMIIQTPFPPFGIELEEFVMSMRRVLGSLNDTYGSLGSACSRLQPATTITQTWRVTHLTATPWVAGCTSTWLGWARQSSTTSTTRSMHYLRWSLVRSR